MAFELTHGFDDEYNELLEFVRPHRGQIKVGRDLREILKDSKLTRSRDDLQKLLKINNGDIVKISDNIQDVYSIRCVPQILGPIYETIKNSCNIINREINSVTDNPIADIKNGKFIHGGNFHGDFVSFEMDKLKIALTKLGMLAERQINFFLNNKINGFLPPFLNLYKPGLTLALQGLQFTATSTAAENQTLCYPNYIHSIPSNADNQDIVSMGTNSAIIAAQIVNGVFHILTINFITLGQAADALKAEKLFSKHSKSIYNQIRELFPAIIEDRDISIELPRLNNYIENNLTLNINF